MKCYSGKAFFYTKPALSELEMYVKKFLPGNVPNTTLGYVKINSICSSKYLE